MKKFLVGTVIGILVMAVHICWAGIPFLMNYQGMLTDDGGSPLNGDYNLTFKIYSLSSGGSALWTETHTGTQVQDGLFNVILGSLSLLPSSVFEDTVRYFGITVGSDPELSPRIRITSIPYAYRALVADSAAVAGSVVGSGGGWVDDGSVVRLETSTDKVGIGTTSPQAGLHLKGTWFPNSFMFLQSDAGQDAGFRLYEGADAKWHIFNSSPDSGLRIYNSDGLKTVFFAEQISGNVGIGTTSPDAILDVYGTRTISASSDGIVNIGNTSSKHVTLDNNEIHGRNGGSASDLYINDFGGDVLLAKNGNVGIGTPSPSSKLHVWGSMAVAVKKVYHSTSPYYLTGSDCIISANAVSGSISIYLPDASGVIGRIYIIKKVDSTSNWVYIWPDSGDKIDSLGFRALGAQWQSVTLVSDGINWLVIGLSS